MTKQKSWRKILPCIADVFPLMSETTPEELKALGEDIAKHGLKNPVDVWASEGAAGVLQLLDGRNHLDAMEAVGILRIAGRLTLEYRLPTGTWTRVPSQFLRGDPFDHVISANIHRRHLTLEQKCELIAKVIEANPEKSDRQIAKQVVDKAGKNEAIAEKLIKAAEVKPDSIDIDKVMDAMLDAVCEQSEPTELTAEPATAPEPSPIASPKCGSTGCVPVQQLTCGTHEPIGPVFNLPVTECGAKLPDNPIARAWHEATDEQRREFALAYNAEINDAALEIPPMLRRTPA
jgi:hypothetical protein